MANLRSCDFLVIGAGIIGINIALELKTRCPDSRVIVIEKEKELGEHGSGRNSGVLHAGFYYTSDSLKAKFTKEGNKLLTQYCLEKGLKINQCGKLVVAKNGEELKTLDELKRRAQKNGVHLKEISKNEAREIEPQVKTYKSALFSPTTSSVDPNEVLSSLAKDAENIGIQILKGVSYSGRINERVITTDCDINTGYIVNAAGLYADKIAKDFGFAKDLTILPFKGLYLYSNLSSGSLKTHIYPVPNLNHPFLGTHFTVTVDGRIKIGPTATPALWRENYKRFQNFNLNEFFQVVATEICLFRGADFDFRSLAFEELRKYFKSYMVRQAKGLLKGIKKSDFPRWGPPGIRAQLFNTKKRKLIMDFCVEGDEKSFHVLNAVSPAFTASIPFSRFVCDQIEKKIN